MRTLKSALVAAALTGMIGCSGDEQETTDAVETPPDDMGYTEAPAPLPGEDPLGTPDATLDPAAPDSGLPETEFAGDPTAAAAAADAVNPSADTTWSTLYVKSQALNVRNRARQTGQVLRIIYRGQSVPNLGREGIWIKIGPGEYASSKHLQNANGQLAYHYFQGTNTYAAGTPGAYKVKGTQFLRVRNAPSNAAAVINKLPMNTTVNVQSFENGGWVKIGPGQFVHKNYLQPALAH